MEKHNSLVLFGNKIRRERLKLGLSQEDFAEITGWHRTYIGRVEKAEKYIS